MSANALEGYLPFEHFQETDDDHSAVRIRDMPFGKRRESLEIYPTEIIFAGVPVGMVSPPYPIMITNDGYDVVIIHRLQIVGDFALQGALSSLVPGEHASLSVTFVPKREGPVTGGLYIDSGSAAGEEFVYLSSPTGGATGGGYSYHLYYLATEGQKIFKFSTKDRFGNWHIQPVKATSLVVTRNGGRVMPMDPAGVGGFTLIPDGSGISLTWPAGQDETIIIDI